ncbi:MAG: MFS transporter [Sphingomonas sp.]|nr:MFS transporter [Sphingomonas sp.]
MSTTQSLAVAIAFLLSALDGFDVLSVTFVAPAIIKAWHVEKGALGVLLSAGLAGMAAGAFILAPIADLAGRKVMVLVALGLMAAGMALSAGAGSLEQLIAWRVVTGVGIGSCVAVINPIATEFANARRRPLTISVMALGYPVGGVVGGLLAAVLLRHYGWQAVFAAGAIGALIMIPAVLLLLPESIAYLVSRKGSLEQLNAVLVRCDQPPLDAWPEESAVAKRGYSALFTREQAAATVWLVCITMLFTFPVYFVLSWLPQMIAEMGFASSTASLASAVASMAGVAGGLVLGWRAQRGGLRWLTSGGMVGLGLATSLFGVTPPHLPMLMAMAAACGFFLFGASCGSFATAATTFKDEARAAGSGFVSGAGRVSSAIAPAAAGWLFAAGFDRAVVSSIFGGFAIAAGAILYFGWGRFRPAQHRLR